MITKKVCPLGKCDGSGAIKVVESGIDRYRNCECIAWEQLQKRLSFARIPEEFRDLTIKSLNLNFYSKTKLENGLSHYQHAAKAKRIAANYVENFPEMKALGKGLYIYYQTPGTGKTHLAVAILNALLKVHNQTGIFVNSLKLMDEIKSLMFDRKDGETTKLELIEAIQNVDVMLLDDIGLESPTNFVRQELYNIINDRYVKKKVTLFTSNCSTDQLPHGERIISRITAITYPVVLPGDDNRNKLAQKLESDRLKKLLEG